jgi:Mn-dependent DtxR family transcriptional regulator
MGEGEIKVKVQVALVAAVIAGTGKRYVTVREVSRLLGVSTRTAGRILARLEEEGYLVRWSRRSYKVVASPGEPAARRSMSRHTLLASAK